MCATPQPQPSLRSPAERTPAATSSLAALSAITSQIATATGSRSPRQVPAAAAMAGATVIELTARLRHRDPAVTRAGTASCSKATGSACPPAAERELGATFPLAQTITDEAAWVPQPWHAAGPPRSSPGRRQDGSKRPAVTITCQMTQRGSPPPPAGGCSPATT
jgi:hypothetical protein